MVPSLTKLGLVLVVLHFVKCYRGYMTTRLTADDLMYLVRAIERELLFVEWLKERTIAEKRSRSAPELTMEAGDLRRLRDNLTEIITAQKNRARRLRATG